MKKLIDILLRASVFYVLFRFLIWIIFVLNRSHGDSICYHYSDNFLWYFLMFILPIIASILIVVKLKSKYIKQVGMILFPILIIGTIFLGYVNNNQWGYWFKRPTVFSELKNAKTIVSISDIIKEYNKEYFKIENSSDLSKELFGRRDIYYAKLDRPIMVFQDNSSKNPDLNNWHEIATDSVTKINQSALNSITKAIIKSNTLIPPSSDTYNERANRFTGRIIEFKTSENKLFYHLAMKSGEISNDHYPFYEFLIEKDQAFKIIKHQTFFFDIAGMEGFEYANFIGLIEFLCLLTIGILVLLYNGTTRILNKKRQ